MSEYVLALLRGIATFMLMIGVGGICFAATTPLTLTCLGLSILLYMYIRYRSSDE